MMDTGIFKVEVEAERALPQVRHPPEMGLVERTHGTAWAVTPWWTAVTVVCTVFVSLVWGVPSAALWAASLPPGLLDLMRPSRFGPMNQPAFGWVGGESVRHVTLLETWSGWLVDAFRSHLWVGTGVVWAGFVTATVLSMLRAHCLVQLQLAESIGARPRKRMAVGLARPLRAVLVQVWFFLQDGVPFAFMALASNVIPMVAVAVVLGLNFALGALTGTAPGAVLQVFGAGAVAVAWLGSAALALLWIVGLGPAVYLAVEHNLSPLEATRRTWFHTRPILRKLAMAYVFAMLRPLLFTVAVTLGGGLVGALLAPQLGSGPSAYIGLLGLYGLASFVVAVVWSTTHGAAAVTAYRSLGYASPLPEDA